MAKVSVLTMRSPATGTRTQRWTEAGEQQALPASQPSPRNGGAMTVTGRGSTGSSGPAISKLPNSDRPGASGATS